MLSSLQADPVDAVAYASISFTKNDQVTLVILMMMMMMHHSVVFHVSKISDCTLHFVWFQVLSKDGEDVQVTYATVRTSSFPAHADLSNVYATVNKPGVWDQSAVTAHVLDVELSLFIVYIWMILGPFSVFLVVKSLFVQKGAWFVKSQRSNTTRLVSCFCELIVWHLSERATVWWPVIVWYVWCMICMFDIWYLCI